ncbi:MAG: hypothetical protein ACX931_13380 [Saccharospirillum sp.]|jgi:hypothetical protein
MNDVKEFELIVSENFDFTSLQVCRDEQGDLQANIEPICEILSASGIEETLVKSPTVLSNLINTLYDFHLENGGMIDLEIERVRAMHELSEHYSPERLMGCAVLQ